jgi:hypothetical protein
MEPYETPTVDPTPVPPLPGGGIAPRNIVLYVILTVVTCGLFGIFWFCTLNDDTNLVSGHPEAPNGVVALLLTFITCGIYGLYWYYAMGQRIDEAKMSRGLPAGSSGALYLILAILGLAFVANIIQQSELNRLAA